MKYFLQDINEFKRESIVEINMDDAKIQPLIPLCYDKYMSNICGIDEYLDFYNDNTHVWTDDEKEYLLLIKKMMYQSITFELLLSSTFNLTNKGLNQRDGDTSSSVQYRDFGAIRNNVKSNIEFYTIKLHEMARLNNKCKCEVKTSNKRIFFV